MAAVIFLQIISTGQVPPMTTWNGHLIFVELFAGHGWNDMVNLSAICSGNVFWKTARAIDTACTYVLIGAYSIF